MSFNRFTPIIMVFISVLWCGLVWLVQSQAGTQGTATLFALLAYAVGGPGILAVASVQSLAFIFVTLAGPYSDDDMEPGGLWYLYCFLCWAACMVLSCLLPILLILKGI